MLTLNRTHSSTDPSMLNSSYLQSTSGQASKVVIPIFQRPQGTRKEYNQRRDLFLIFQVGVVDPQKKKKNVEFVKTRKGTKNADTDVCPELQVPEGPKHRVIKCRPAGG